MSDPFTGILEGLHSGSSIVTITLNADKGKIIVRDTGGKDILELGDITFSSKAGVQIGVAVLDDGLRRVVLTSKGNISAGGDGANGTLILRSTNDEPRIHLDAEQANVWLGGKGKDGDMALFHQNETDNDDLDKASIHLNSQIANITLRRRENGVAVDAINLDGLEGNILLGGKGRDGDLVLFHQHETDNSDLDKATIHLNSQEANITLRHRENGVAQDTINLDGLKGNILLGGKGKDGDLALFHQKNSDTDDLDRATIHLNGSNGAINLRRWDMEQQSLMDTIRLETQQGNIWLGGKGRDGDLMLFSKDEAFNDDSDKATIHLNGNAGDIILRNADCAEDFDIVEAAEAEPGNVMVIDDEGKLKASDQAYDKRVAGVLSGAGDFRPGIILDKQSTDDRRKPVALVGKVYCKADARYVPIEVGDLLTTSPTRGHAMKAADPDKAFGAVIGKALRPLPAGQGLIPILIALQ